MRQLRPVRPWGATCARACGDPPCGVAKFFARSRCFGKAGGSGLCVSPGPMQFSVRTAFMRPSGSLTCTKPAMSSKSSMVHSAPFQVSSDMPLRQTSLPISMLRIVGLCCKIDEG